MNHNDRQQWYGQAVAIFRRMLRTQKPVAFEEAIWQIDTPDWFDRRGFGWIPAAMHRDGEIVPAGFRESVNARHHSGVKRLWVLATAKKKGAADA